MLTATRFQLNPAVYDLSPEHSALVRQILPDVFLPNGDVNIDAPGDEFMLAVTALRYPSYRTSVAPLRANYEAVQRKFGDRISPVMKFVLACSWVNGRLNTDSHDPVEMNYINWNRMRELNKMTTLKGLQKSFRASGYSVGVRKVVAGEATLSYSEAIGYHLAHVDQQEWSKKISTFVGWLEEVERNLFNEVGGGVTEVHAPPNITLYETGHIQDIKIYDEYPAYNWKGLNDFIDHPRGTVQVAKPAIRKPRAKKGAPARPYGPAPLHKFD